MHPFDADFYGHEMKAIVLGYIRPQLDYTSRGAYQSVYQIMSHSDRFPITPDWPPPVFTTLSHVFPVFPEGLIEDIETDKRVALKSLARPAYQKFAHDEHFDLTPVHEIHH